MASEHRDVKVLICTATTAEAKACLKGISDSGLEDRFEILKTGIGYEQARQALIKRLRRLPYPRLIVSSGFAGSWSPELEVGAWVFAQNLWRQEAADVLPIAMVNQDVFHPWGRAVAGMKFFDGKIDLQIRECNLISVDGIKKENSYPEVPPPVAVDMESAALAHLSNQAGLRFLALRLITDSLDRPLPPFVADWTQVAATSSYKQRIFSSLRGMKNTVTDPKGIFQMLYHSPRWCLRLRDGWARYAGHVVECG